MIRSWSEKQSAALAGKWYSLKTLGYDIFLMDAVEIDDHIEMDYILEKEGKTENIHIKLLPDSTIPSVTSVFPRGKQMEQEIEKKFPVHFRADDKEEITGSGYSHVEWGPCHPLLPEPVQLKMLMQDEIIQKTSIELGYHHRGIEKLCIGKKIVDIPDLLERLSGANGITACLAFLHAAEEINGIDVPDKARWLRMIINEMSHIYADLHGLNYTAQCLGLLSDSACIIKLIEQYQEAARFLCDHPLLFGLLKIGGMSRDVHRETLFSANALFQDMVVELSAIKEKWERMPHFAKRLKSIGEVKCEFAMMMTGRSARAAGFADDSRKYSALPYNEIAYETPVAKKSDCYARIILKFDDLLQSLSIIDQGIEQMPKGEIRRNNETNGSGVFFSRESGADGELVGRIKLEEGRVVSLKLRNATSLNVPFLPQCIRKEELSNLPLIVSSFDLDLAGMEK